MIKALRESFTIMVRPFHGYGNIKFESQGSVAAAWVMVALAVVTTFTRQLYAGVAYNTFNPSTFNLLRELASMALPYFLFVLGNWAVSTILDGEGNMAEIFQACGFALLPYVLASLLATVLTHMLTLDESFLITTLEGVGAFWSCFLVFSGLTVMHQYTARKTVGILLLTVAFMGVTLFIMILLASIADKLIAYIASIISEIKLRF